MNQANPANLSGLHRFQDECLRLLTGLFNAQKAVTYLVDSRAKPICYKYHQMQASMHRDYIDNFYMVDPLYPANFKEKEADVVKMNDLVAAHSRSNHPYYKGFVAPWGIRDIVEMFFHIDGKLVAGAALFTSTKEAELGAEELKQLQHLHRFMQYSLEESLSTPTQTSFETLCDSYNLTAKERVVTQLVVDGLPNKSIALNLCCSVATVKTHLQHIFHKMGVNSKAEVANLIFRANCVI